MARFWLQQKAEGVCNGTGGGVCDAALELKRQSEWNNDSPEWVRQKKGVFEPILKECKYYFELEPIFATQHGNTRLSVAHDLPPKTEDEDGSNPDKRDPLEHSPNSNLAYKDHQYENLDHNSPCDPLQQSLDSNINSDNLMERLGQVFDEEELLRPRSPSVALTQTPCQSPTPTSPPLKQNASRNSLQSNLQSHHANHFKRGAASQVHDLVQSQLLSCGSRGYASVKPSNQIDDIISRQDIEFDRICHVADKIANILPQAPKPILDKKQEHKKTTIELKMAEVVLECEKKKLDLYDFDLNVKREHHKLEMQGKRDKLEHQKTARHAQLIGLLMKETNLTLKEAVSAAQSVAGIVSQQKL
ncbi:hypothetical protein DFH28DRAFT_1080439 [Melampsora americana]|nr:hypothetical protein DFH28DRAFT_1080439 [Melampsora americana]